jgi:ubiquinone/menaquinone biosynthesis C-methylase UbiE
MPDYWDNLMQTDEAAARYMETYGEGVGSATREMIANFINDGEMVHDVGCGPAWNYEHFKNTGLNILYSGSDLSPRFVRVANKRIQEKYGESPIILADARRLPFKDGQFDVVILQDILEHTNGYEKPVKEALRVSRKRVIISFWHMEENTQTHINDDTDKGENGYGAWYNKGEWETYLDKLGYFWTQTETPPDANRHHLFYVIDKQENYE